VTRKKQADKVKWDGAITVLTWVLGIPYFIIAINLIINPVDTTVTTNSLPNPYFLHFVLGSFIVWPLIFMYLSMKNYTISLKNKLIYPPAIILGVLLIGWMRFDSVVQGIADDNANNFLTNSQKEYDYYSKHKDEINSDYRVNMMTQYDMLTYAKKEGIPFGTKFENMDDDVKAAWQKKYKESYAIWSSSKSFKPEKPLTQQERDDRIKKQFEDAKAAQKASQKIDLDKEMATFKKEMTKGLNPENPVRQVIDGVGVENGKVTYGGAGLTPKANQDLESTKKEFE
jgi:hypothetical protein